VIQLRSPGEIEPDRQGGWQLLLWVGEAFDFTTPFRSMLADIAGALGQDCETDLVLPDYEEGEDFIEGTLMFRAVRLRVYYEYSLGYLAVMSDSEAVIRDVADRLGTSILSR
jgi:hypothetical protein